MVFDQSAALYERAKRSLAGGVSSEFRKYSYPHPLFFSSAFGARIQDVDGNEFLDFSLSQGPMLIGHSHPKVLDAVNDYSRRGQLFAGQHVREIILAEKLLSHIPSADVVRFCLDGSEAIQAALRLARARTGKNKFLRFEGHYHGWLDSVAWGISTPAGASLGEPDWPEVYPWTQGIATGTRDEFLMLPWNNLPLVEKTLSLHHADIAAIITEPIMCNAGCILPVNGFLKGLRELCNRYGIALIFDEVITGFRTSMGGAQAYFNVSPDISIFAKAMASGYPISAVLGKNEWMKGFIDGSVIHAGTMNSSNPTVAAALATLEVLEEPGVHDRIFQLGKTLMQGLKELAKKHRQPLLVQGLGPVFHTGFTNRSNVNDYRDTLSYDKILMSLFVNGLQEKGIRILGRGLWYISTVHTRDDINQALEAVQEVLATMPRTRGQ